MFSEIIELNFQKVSQFTHIHPVVNLVAFVIDY